MQDKKNEKMLETREYGIEDIINFIELTWNYNIDDKEIKTKNLELQEYINNNTKEICEKLSEMYYLYDFIKLEKNNQTVLDYFANNLDNITNNMDDLEILELLEIENLNKECIEEYMNNNIGRIMSEMYNKEEYLSYARYLLDKDNLMEGLEIEFEENLLKFIKRNLGTQYLNNWIKENFDKLMDDIRIKKIELIDILKQDRDMFNIINSNQDKILESYDGKNKIQLAKNILKNPSEYIEKNFDKIIMKITELSRDNKQQSKLLDSIELIIKEIAEFEKVGIQDIEYIGSGASSSAIQIGNKVLKTSWYKQGYEIQYHPRLLESTLRHKSNSIGDDEFFIELLEKVDVKDITEDDVQKVYNELRDDGILWYDAKKDNLGKLLKSNKIHFYKDYEITDEQRGIKQGNISKKVLPEGELVILDLEHLISVKEIEEKGGNVKDFIEFSNNTLSLEYEKNYQKMKKEKQEEIIK